MTAPKRRRDPGRRPSAAALGAAANGDWTSHAACRNQPDYTSQDPDSITYTCGRCSVAADCAQLGKLELARAITDTAGRQAAYRALDTTLRASAAWSVLGYNCTHCGQTPDNCTCVPPEETRHTRQEAS